MISAKQYEKAQALLAKPKTGDPNEDLTDEMTARLLEETQAYENAYLGKAAAGEPPLAQGQNYRLITQASAPAATPAAAPPPEMPMSSGVDPRTNTNDELEAHRLLMQLDPNQPLAPQVLATQPATTHPLGDEAAKHEWLHGDLANPKGTTIVYDAPAEVVRQKLVENPQLWRALGMSVPLTPDKAMHIKQGDSVHRAYNDLYWRLAATDLASQGKTAYRYSAAPWLASGKNASFLQNLKTKYDAEPEGDQGTAFVLGMDQGSYFGGGRAAAEAANPSLHLPEQPNAMGGIPRNTDLRSYDAMVQDEHPWSYALGALAGPVALGPWALSNQLFGKVYGGASGLIGGQTPGALRGAVAGGIGAGTGAAAVQAANDAVRAGSDLEQSGGTESTVLGTLGHATLAGLESAPLGAFLGGMQGVGNTVRASPRYEGLPARIEALGGEAKLGRGFVDTPGVAAARSAALVQNKTPAGVIAEQLQKPLAEAAAKEVSGAEAAQDAHAAAYYPTAEGKVTPPSTNLVQSALDRLRVLTSKVPRRGQQPVALPNADHPVAGIFNNNIEGVSAKQGKYGVPLSLDEAKSFLSPEWQDKLDFDKLAAKGVTTVYVTPRRYDAEHFDEAIRQLEGSKDPDVQAVHEAALKDRDTRSLNGVRGAYSQQRTQDAEAVARAEELARVAPDERGAYQSLLQASKQKGVETPDVKALGTLAQLAGGSAPDLLRGQRLVGPLDRIQGWQSFGRSPPGLSLPFKAQKFGDAAVLRMLYPGSQFVASHPDALLQLDRAVPNVTGATIDEMAREDERRRREKEKQK